jgi:hypothetical protein
MNWITLKQGAKLGFSPTRCLIQQKEKEGKKKGLYLK